MSVDELLTEEQLEAFHKIPGFNTYGADQDGRIVWLTNGWRRGRLVRGAVSNNNYPTVCLTDDKGKKCTERRHRLVARTWLGECPKGLECEHQNENKNDCSAGNLQYVTHAQNVARARKNGNGGGTTGKKKFRKDQIETLFGLLESGKINTKEAAKATDRHYRSIVQMRTVERRRRAAETGAILKA